MDSPASVSYRNGGEIRWDENAGLQAGCDKLPVTTHPLEAPGLAWRTEVAAEIRIHDLSMSGVDQLVDMLYCVQRTAARANYSGDVGARNRGTT